MERKGKILTTVSIIAISSIVFVAVIFMGPSPGGFLILPPSAGKTTFPIYARNTTIDSNNYGIRIDSGNNIVENSLTITAGKLNGISILNSTKLDNCTSKATSLSSINIFNDAKLTMRNINAPTLNFFLFNNSELVLENSTINKVTLVDNSKIQVINSTVQQITDSGSATPSFLGSKEINILPNSTVQTLWQMRNSTLYIKNASINMLYLACSYELIGLSGHPLPATIINSTIFMIRVSLDSSAMVYNSIITLAMVTEVARLTLNSSSVSSLSYGIICYTDTTNINNGILPAPGNYENNTKIINMPLPALSSFTSIAVNNSAIVNINGWSAMDSLELYLYDTASAQINNVAMGMGTVRTMTYDNSQLTIKNSNVTTLYSYGYSQALITNSTVSGQELFENSKVTINNSTAKNIVAFSVNSSLIVMNNSLIPIVSISTSNTVSINFSTITQSLTLTSPRIGLPTGNTRIVNCSINLLAISGSAVVSIENCTITSLAEGYVIYSGTVLYDENGLSGTGNYVNYTTIITSSIGSSSILYIEVNNTASISIHDLPNLELIIILIENAGATLDNSSFTYLCMSDNSKAILYNSSTVGLIGITLCGGNSDLTIDQNSQISAVLFTETSIGTIKNSTIQSLTVIGAARVTAQLSEFTSIGGYCSNPTDHSIKIYDSTVSSLQFSTW
ncbi:MAG: hypothetical protein ACFFDN_02530 [Candidatus Hodarchaeota archaeon]